MIYITDVEILDTLKQFIIDNIASKIKLKKPSSDGNVEESEYELVNPAVYTMYIPPKNILDDYGYDIPAILIMIDNMEDDNDSASLVCRLSFVVYDPGEVDEDGIFSPNVEGYKDLLNLKNKFLILLSENPVIKEKFSINKPIKWSMDEETIYPYYAGNLEFEIPIAPLNFIPNYQKYL